MPPNSVFRTEIGGGLVIPHSEALKWYIRKYNRDLSHLSSLSVDLTIFSKMLVPIQQHGYDIVLVAGPDTKPGVNDILLITRRVHGEFLHTGWNVQDQMHEVVQDDLKDILKPGEAEDRVRDVLSQNFGR